MKGRALFTNSRVAKCDKKLTLCTSDAILILKGYTNKCWFVTGKAELESTEKREERGKSLERNPTRCCVELRFRLTARRPVGNTIHRVRIEQPDEKQTYASELDGGKKGTFHSEQTLLEIPVDELTLWCRCGLFLLGWFWFVLPSDYSDL